MTFPGPPTRESFRESLGRLSEEDFARTYYCFYMGNVFVALSLLEQTIMDAMLTCNKVRVGKVSDHRFEEAKFLAKHHAVRSSTLGSLIEYLRAAGVSPAGLSYLNFLKRNRDLFIHNFFREHAWPGDLQGRHLEFHIRRLRYLEIVFSRGTHRIWKILSDSGLFHRVDLGNAGALIMNTDFEGLAG